MTQLGKDRIAARDLDELLHPLDARNERVVPLLEKHARPRWKLRRQFAKTVEIRREPGRERLGFVAAADETADHADHLQDLGNTALVEGHDRMSATDQLAREVRLKIGEREDQVWSQRLYPVEFRADERRHSRLLPRLRRTHR